MMGLPPADDDTSCTCHLEYVSISSLRHEKGKVTRIEFCAVFLYHPDMTDGVATSFRVLSELQFVLNEDHAHFVNLTICLRSCECSSAS